MSIRGHAIVHLWSTFDTLLRRSASFDLAIASVALFRVGRQGGFSSHIVNARPLVRLAFDYWVVYFYKVYSNTLDICLRWILIRVQSGNTLEVSAPFSMVICFLNISDVFGVGSKVFDKFLQSFPRDLDCLSRLFSLGVSTIVARSSTAWPIIWRRSFWGILLVPQFPMMTGDTFFWRHWFILSWSIFSLPYSPVFSWRIRSQRTASLIYYELLSVTVFPRVLWRGEEKIEAIK